MPQTPTGCSCFLLVWLFGWTAGTLAFDAFIGCALYQQMHALTFATTEGTVTKRAVRTESDSDGDASYRLDIAYDYQVNGRRYTGTRYSHSEMGTNSKAWHKISAALPPGTRVEVWYDPADPGESLLRPRLTGFHLSMVWFLTPFNVIMLGGWVAFARRRPAFNPENPRWVEQTPTGARVRLPTLGRAARFGGCLLAVTFAGVFVIGFGFGFDPPVLVGGGAYLAAVAVASFLALRYTPPVLDVNEGERVLRLTRDGETIEVPFAAVRGVRVAHEETTDSEGAVTHKYHCDLDRTDAPEAEVRIATFDESEVAERFAAWLRAQAGIAGPEA